MTKRALTTTNSKNCVWWQVLLLAVVDRGSGQCRCQLFEAVPGLWGNDDPSSLAIGSGSESERWFHFSVAINWQDQATIMIEL
ncbi:hypothetical protein CY34DRAFT_797714 [Suillus luteus UH-Slu-Lm8-n1]|uniref:Secreted protein n=1 Tax=Suillus luteus UH-Slu-Lm8-n1 TaxID=930992 RepID=A0A0D0C1Z5_9AGAM|nr:hypothetical protein CY34DRAFT_797714 [Suillus luteus UH-Slu-Lm8-n1]